ncbi:putative Autophagy-related protein 27 [Monocercomonoides exilis]|uniref:putative Autophagy-related protein 27 n=1 Tax=Monocercomonoides exilis TaxID=2049356 RepID=UPI003559CE6D|nr:putative Autophagy-related protein 27 [Monocercomonoides exilis]|eukprot:MONOS_1694.1-p1 / transcript=MONOS_1694.1 / gene=MONOS_1694 / organism=Monocercomonoides_exilis_PA203 / gene_product=unspecified product / transcript_product=unspecified product / location=Mono_scaffold00031:114865-115844(-) / protein_length=249 / sequence_SO=supercontig / SO=protein_coding / is_pseudo=false
MLKNLNSAVIRIFTLVAFLQAYLIDDYKLDGLTKDKPYVVGDEEDKWAFNFRKAIPTCEETKKACESENCNSQKIFNSTETTTCYCFGLYNMETYKIKDDGKEITFTYKYEGNEQNVLRTTVVHFICSDIETPTLEYDLQTETKLDVTWKHKQACPFKGKPESEKKKEQPAEKKKVSFGTVMLIIISCSAALYFLIGVPICFFMKKRGPELIPFWPLWCKFGSLVVDGVKFLLSPCLRKSKGYETVKS